MGIIERLKAAFNPQQDVDNNLFMDRFGMKMVFERKPLPSPGAMNYAYETLALAPQSEISGAVANRSQLMFIAQQVYKFQDVPLAGIGTVSGAMVTQPIFDPTVGYTNLPHTNAAGDLVSANIVADRQGPRPTNAPFLNNM